MDAAFSYSVTLKDSFETQKIDTYQWMYEQK